VFDWERAARRVIPVLTDLLAKPIESGPFYNVNLPLLPPGADVNVCFRGRSAITAVRLL
jgi:broad specificity polyphosphatase/5'/3'-nucleotidase SurE